jgi:hypothetical protein
METEPPYWGSSEERDKRERLTRRLPLAAADPAIGAVSKVVLPAAALVGEGESARPAVRLNSWSIDPTSQEPRGRWS